jgi:two-component system, NarL family, response regulator LiaR
MAFLKQFFHRSRHIVFYGMLMAVMVFGLKWLQWKYVITDNSTEIYLGLMAVFFTCLGVWAAGQLSKPKTRTKTVEQKESASGDDRFSINQAELQRLNLTAREYDVLKLLSKGCSNAEIAENLFLSVSTVKTHVSNVYVKMDVRSRTQAVEKAKRLRITP